MLLSCNVQLNYASGIILQFLHERISEDCLFLNIYTPVSSDQTDKLPVMVFLHGGEFIGGTGNQLAFCTALNRL